MKKINAEKTVIGIYGIYSEIWNAPDTFHVNIEENLGLVSVLTGTIYNNGTGTAGIEVNSSAYTGGKTKILILPNQTIKLKNYPAQKIIIYSGSNIYADFTVNIIPKEILGMPEVSREFGGTNKIPQFVEIDTDPYTNNTSDYLLVVGIQDNQTPNPATTGHFITTYGKVSDPLGTVIDYVTYFSGQDYALAGSLSDEAFAHSWTIHKKVIVAPNYSISNFGELIGFWITPDAILDILKG